MTRRAAAAFALLAFAAAPTPAAACTTPVPVIFFATGSAEVDEASGRILDRLVVALHRSEAGRGLRYVIMGHGDRAGTEEYNLALSRRRAEAVRDYLLERGISFGAIERIEGFGEDSAAGRHRRRRGRAAQPPGRDSLVQRARRAVGMLSPAARR